MRVKIFLALIFALTPGISFATRGICSEIGFTIATLNGIFTKEEVARGNMIALQKEFGFTWNEENVDYQYLHNKSHLAGLGDIMKVVTQKLNDFQDFQTKDYDLIELLEDASEKVATQKLLLVAHSQGNFYANSFYDAVAGQDGGVPVQSIGVYGVASPASRVAGGGKWLTSDTDKVIAGLVGNLPLPILPSNTHIETDDPTGHSFTETYLKHKGDVIVSDIENALSKLQANDVQTGSCIDPPALSFTGKVFHGTKTVAFAVADPAAEAVRDTAVGTTLALHKTGVVVGDAGAAALTAIGNTSIRAGVGAYKGGMFVLKTSGKLAAGAVNAITLALEGGRRGRVTYDNAGLVAAVVSNDSEETQAEEPSVTETKQETSSSVEERLPQEPAPSPAAPKTVPKQEPAPVIVPQAPPIAPAPLLVTPAAPSFGAPTEPRQFFMVPGFGGGTPAPSTPPDTTAPSAPVVTTNTSSVFRTTSVTLGGTAEANATILTGTSDTASVNGSGSWSITLSLSQGTNTIDLYARDAAGNTSASTTVSITVDSLGPSFASALNECGYSLSASSCLIATTTASLTHTSSASDLLYFVIDKGGTVSTTTASATAFSFTDGTTATVTIAALDTSGNSSATTTYAVSVETEPLVISEVAWMGTNASSADEWIELYNKTSRTLDLSSVVIRTADDDLYAKLSGTVAANSYYLIERKNTGETNEATESPTSVTAGLWTSFGAGLNNDGEDLLLALVGASGTTTLDQVRALSGWPAGNNSSRISMERIDADTAGTVSSNWGTALTLDILNGTDVNGTSIYGTPGRRNGLSYLISQTGTLASNTTLSAAKSPYFVQPTGLTINSGVTLTIPAGVVVKFAPIHNAGTRAITVNGSLVTQGSSGNPVVFTAINDDTYGGDVNGDGSTSIANWYQILVFASGSSFSNTIFRYGGGGAANSMVHVYQVPATFSSVTVEQAPIGIRLENSTTTISNSTFANINSANASKAVYLLSGGGSTITESSFSDVDYGIYAESVPRATFTSNTFTGSSIFPIYSFGSLPSISANSGSGNEKNGIALEGAITEVSATTTLAYNSMPYILFGTVAVGNTGKLEFGENIVVKGNDGTASQIGRLQVKSGGFLYANGTSTSSLLFTSLYDSTAGGQTSSARSAGSGDWHGIDVENGGRVYLKGFTLRYAGTNSTYNIETRGALRFFATPLDSVLEDGLIENNRTAGVAFLGGGNITMRNLTVRNHTLPVTAWAYGLDLNTTVARLYDMTFSNNVKDIGAASSGEDITCSNCDSPVTSPSDLLD